MTDSSTARPPADAPVVRVYWRPGCGFCALLRRRLRHAGLEVEEVDIWGDADAAAFVRAHAGGNETVPTVDVAGTVRVNPSAAEVVDLARAAGLTVDPPPRRARRWSTRLGGRSDGTPRHAR